MKSLKSLAIAATLVCASATQAATIFNNTDGDVNISEFTIANLINVQLSSGVLYVFDNDTAATDYGTADNLKVTLGGEIKFNGNVASNENGTLNLSNNAAFKIVLFDKGSWSEDIAYTANGNVGILSFGEEHNVVVSDVQEVPVPAAAWLFGSAMLGLAGVKRRK